MDYSDLLGKRFGKLTVLSFAGFIPYGHKGKHRSAYKCQCDCGNICVVTRQHLIGGKQTTCCNCFRIVPQDDHYEYICSDGQKFLFDADDLDFIKSHRWYLDINGYAITCLGKGHAPLTRLLLHPGKNEYVDHINGNTRDNRRSNLRLASCLENQRNMRISKNNSSGFKGVSFRKERNKYRAYISVHDHYIHLGHFDTAEQAARAYDQAARFYFGDFACVNFPEENEQGCRIA